MVHDSRVHDGVVFGMFLGERPGIAGVGVRAFRRLGGPSPARTHRESEHDHRALTNSARKRSHRGGVSIRARSTASHRRRRRVGARSRQGVLEKFSLPGDVPSRRHGLGIPSTTTITRLQQRPIVVADSNGNTVHSRRHAQPRPIHGRRRIVERARQNRSRQRTIKVPRRAPARARACSRHRRGRGPDFSPEPSQSVRQKSRRRVPRLRRRVVAARRPGHPLQPLRRHLRPTRPSQSLPHSRRVSRALISTFVIASYRVVALRSPNRRVAAHRAARASRARRSHAHRVALERECANGHARASRSLARASLASRDDGRRSRAAAPESEPKPTRRVLARRTPRSDPEGQREDAR